MRTVWVAVFVCVPVHGFAQGPTSPTSRPAVTSAEGSVLPGGTEVSRPLTPVEAEPPPTPLADPIEPPKPAPVQRVEDVQDQKYVRRGPLGPSWDDSEFLLWWPKAKPIPALVTTARGGAPPLLGDPRTTLVVGGHSLNNQDVAGGRFTLGGSINSEQTIGLEATYFFLGTRTLSATVRDFGNPQQSLGLPFFNALTGKEDVFLVAGPGTSNGSVFVSATTRVQGVEANGVANLYDGTALKLNGIVGYRFLQVNEGLAIEQMRFQFTAPGQFGPIYDGFDGHNQFNGGQLGLHADVTRGIAFCELTGKVAIGMTSEVVKVSGATALYAPILGGVSVERFPGGVYALPSNIGQSARSAFAVVPEGTIRVGIKFGEMGRFFVGYNFLYLSNLARPGDQIDRTLNPGQIPVLNPAGGFVGVDRPRLPFGRSDFSAQGLIIGLETRY